jgi:hypothetical protein
MGFPKFEGQPVAAARLKLNGFGEDLADTLKLGDTVYYVVEALVDDVQHPKKKGVITRTHKGIVQRTCQMDEIQARQMLDAEEERRHLLEVEQQEKQTGQDPLDDEVALRRGRKDIN